MRNDEETVDIFENDSDLVILRQHVSSDFLDAFKDGVNTVCKRNMRNNLTTIQR